MRVLHLIVSLERGGAEHSLLELARAQAPDVEQWMCSIKPGGGLRSDFMAVLPGRVSSLNATREADLRALPRLIWLLRAVRPALLHTWMFHANVLGRIAGRIAGVPVVCGIRSDEFGKRSWRVALDRATNRLPVHTVAVSQATLDTGVRRDGVLRDRACVIPNGVTQPERAAALEGLSKRQPVIGTVGRLERVKDHVTLVKAFAEVVAQHPGARLEIVGKGAEQDRIKRLATELGLDQKVILRGEIPNARELLGDWDVFVQSSLSEGLPRAVLEAMAIGLPVVATEVGGVREAVDAAGVLVPPNQPHHLATAVLSLIDNPVRARELASKARRRVATKFTHEAFIERHLALYRELVPLRA